ncbi:amidohydrolase [Paenibacillus baekrokdamisoli]|uniref:Amidohydrolase n=1 Tax=Paenibacillus baekrokdamisoli TaxID=1712516 RepID=A0A3G9JHH5_9BACL|nr:M20 family metallopeptidase [Paenibacillus baekrokdamisoli]MBB3068666.1 hippurate hydrolase [Paenibacillus baekrokdamisoli]BBH23498.1 amidohydrolase [Paenibacillus baekrokdamisoli]
MTMKAIRDLLPSAKAIERELIELRRKLHRNPELSFEESETAAAVAELLRGLGLEVRSGIGGHGVVAELTGSRPGPRIALRADMDALPIQEETDLPYASERPGKMHACGHDAHTAILYGAAKLLSERKDQLVGSVRFIFQSAEEINAGAQVMIEQGVLEGVDEIFGLHNLPTLPAGKAATRYGALMGSVDRFELNLTGKGGHGAIPDQCVDPVVAASAIILSLQSAVSREISPFDPVVVTVGSIHGGASYNVIPERVEMTGTVRTFSRSVQEGMPSRLERLINQTAEAYRCKAELRYTQQVPVLVNHDDNVRHVEDAIDLILGLENRVEANPVLAGEDFSVYLQHVPGCFFWLGSGPATGAEQAYGLHHPKFAINEDCLSVGAALLAAISIHRLGV